jgi:hypothetical protein
LGPQHGRILLVNGVHLLGSLELAALAAGGVDESTFVMQPLKIRGGTGFTVAPARDPLSRMAPRVPPAATGSALNRL